VEERCEFGQVPRTGVEPKSVGDANTELNNITTVCAGVLVVSFHDVAEKKGCAAIGGRELNSMAQAVRALLRENPSRFDLIRLDGTDVSDRSFEERRDLLVSLGLDSPGWATSEAFDDGQALYAGVCEHGLEGVVAKKRASPYRSGQRGWVKVNNPAYWRRESEVEAMQRSRSRW